MLVVTANWAFSDGTLAASPPRAVVAGFRREVRRAAVRAGVRRDGRYEPVDGVEIVLAGDTFDWLVSREWLGDERPWHASRRGRAAFARVVAGSLRRADWLAGVTARWARCGIEVPAADRRARPVVGRDCRVPVRVTLLRGDRDRGLDALAGDTAAAAALRRRGVVLGLCWASDTATVRHGAEMDPLCTVDAGGATVAETLAVDLVARFAAAVVDTPALRGVAQGLVDGLVRGRIIDAPILVARRLAAAARGGIAGPGVLAELRDRWNRSVSGWHRGVRRCGLHGGSGCDLAAALAAWLSVGHDALERVAAGDVAEPPAILAAGDREPSTPDVPLTVLGHPAASAAAAEAWRGRVVCLGPEAATAGPGPARREGVAAVVASGGGAADVEWLPIDGRPPTMDGGPGSLTSAVWRSDSSARPRVLDAA